MSISDASKIVSDGKFKISLYHATSKHFLGSIENHGLGGINIITEWGIDKAFHRLFQLCDEHFSNEWGSERRIYKEMLEQVVKHMNFRHGSVYLTPSWRTASNYAENRYGSEYVSYAIKLLDKLEKNNFNFNENDRQNLSKCLEMKKLSFAPVILEISNIAVDYTQSEQGENSTQNIAFMDQMIKRAVDEWGRKRETYRKARNGDIDALGKVMLGGEGFKEEVNMEIEDIISDCIEEMCQQTNFELKQKIPFSQIKVHHLEK